jgi:hypothetical protein
MTLQVNETPHIKEICSIGKGNNPESPIPPTPSINLVNPTNPVTSSSSSFASLVNSSSGNVVNPTVISQLGP